MLRRAGGYFRLVRGWQARPKPNGLSFNAFLPYFCCSWRTVLSSVMGFCRIVLRTGLAADGDAGF
ncbi:hypothetical protein SynNOUM97013_02384 [Synechococcus sp. NOUM97013]|nr:hypothetical protein SynNOUM97013_02384 [Synechococcus sp. NOUM97013]